MRELRLRPDWPLSRVCVLLLTLSLASQESFAAKRPSRAENGGPAIIEEIEKKAKAPAVSLASRGTATRAEIAIYDSLIQQSVGAPGQPPAELRAEVEQIYAQLTAQASSSVPALAISDCGSVSARVTFVGRIEICREALRVLRTRDEVAFLLAHELGHAIMNHAPRVAAEPILGADLDNTLSHIQGLRQRTLARRAVTPKWTYLLGLVSEPYSAKAYRFARDQEQQADYLAVDLMVRAGFSPDGAYTAIESFPNASGQDATRVNATHPPIEDRLANALSYIERLYAKADDAEQTAAEWAENPSAEVRTYFEALRLLREAAHEFVVAYRLDIKIRQLARQRIYGPTTTEWSQRELFCASSMSKLAMARRKGLRHDRKASEFAAAIGPECQRKGYSLSALAMIEGTPADGAWRMYFEAYNHAYFGVEEERQTAKRSMNDVLRRYDDNLAVLGSVFVYGNMHSDQRLVDSAISSCFRTAGSALSASSEEDCRQYFNFLILQGIEVADSYGLEFRGESSDAYRYLTMPLYSIKLPSNASLDPTQYALADWREAAYASEGWALIGDLPCHIAPAFSSPIVRALQRGQSAAQTGERRGIWHEVVVEGSTCWIEGKRLLRFDEFMGADYVRAREALGLSVPAKRPKQLSKSLIDSIWAAGIHPIE